MFSIDFWQEILHTIKTNKLRTGLTGFSVAWGIFILIILLGAGNGLRNGVKDKFSRGAVNSIWIFPGQTSRPYKGLPEGRPIFFHNDDYAALKRFKEVEAITGGLPVTDNGRLEIGKNIISYKNNFGVFEILSCHPDQAIADQITVDQGRFINQIDIDQFRKFTAITTVVKEALFKNEDPLGAYINVKGVPFKVVGVFHDASAENSRRIFLPLSTRQRVFNGGDGIFYFGMTLVDMTVEEIEHTITKIRQYFAGKYTFDPEDLRAIYIGDMFKQYKQFMNLFASISMVVWAVGIMTIITGIMGVSNIMVIAVKERTHEIGIRKALGATPGSIVTQIISEAILITGVAGFFGMSMGVFLLDFCATNLPAFDYFKNPGVNVWVMLSAAAVIVFSGALAGMFPALHAAKIRPIEALRDE
jgi:putative ABC transport system permease protein